MKAASLFSGRRRYIALFLFFNIAINYMDRVNLGVAAPAIARQFRWDPAQMGWLFSAYSWTYALCLLPWGWLADRFNARRISAIAIFVWSAAAMLTGAAANLAGMMGARLTLGVGEGASIPVSNKIIRQWFPAEERGFVTTLFHSGIFVTIALSSPFVAWLVVRAGWRVSFFITGSFGLVWLLLWLWRFEGPEACAWLPEAERKFILSRRDGGTPPASGSRDLRQRADFLSAAGSLLRNQSMWGLAIALGCVNYMNYVFLNWLPTYFQQTRGINLLEAGIYSGIPYVVGAVLELCFGRLSDLVLTPERLKQGARRYQVVLFTLLSTAILLINATRSQAATLAILSFALACNTTVIAILYALTNDLIENPRLAGTAFGILLLGGNLIGSPASVITGYLLRASGSFSTAFAISGALPVLGAAIVFAFTRRPIRDFAPATVGEPRVAVP